jgi:hypothetical protein
MFIAGILGTRLWARSWRYCINKINKVPNLLASTSWCEEVRKSQFIYEVQIAPAILSCKTGQRDRDLVSGRLV